MMGMKLVLSSAKYRLRLPSLSSSLLFNYRLTSSSSSSLLCNYRHSSSWSTSSPSSKYELMFPSFNRNYVRNIVDWYTSLEDFEEFEDGIPDSYLIDFIEVPHKFPDFYQNPHYMHNLNGKIEPISIQDGQHFDVISLLSTHGDDLVRISSNNNNFDLVKANNLRGKYVLLCCIFIPSLWIDYDSRECRLLSSQLSHMGLGSNLEVVFVPKMRRKWDNDEGVFNHFFTAFPGCLVVPFTHKYRRDYICKSLNFDGQTKAFLLDTSHNVLVDEIGSIIDYGARGYNYLMSLAYQHSFTPSPPNNSLAGLLCCESNPSFLLHKLDSEETISIEQLNNHYVGLYLFRQGCCFKILRNIYQQCRDQGLNFEVVLVCIPFNTPIHPEMFQDVVHCVMKKHQVSDWWVFPYNHSTCLRLEDLWDSGCGDHLIVVGPENKFVEMQAGRILDRFGLHFGTEAYPFTMEALLQAFLRRLDTITIESFLTYDYVYRDYKCDDGERMLVSELKGKNVLVYVDDATCIKTASDYHCRKVKQWHNKIKKKDPDFQVVFVPFIDPKHDSEYLDLSSNARKCISKSKTKWLVCPFDDPKHSQFLMNHDAFLLRCGMWMAEKGLPIPSVLAFSEDGHLYSLDALQLFHSHGRDAYPFLSESRNLNMCDEITEVLYEEFDLRYYVESDLEDDIDVLQDVY